jgi:hypothetical protein
VPCIEVLFTVNEGKKAKPPCLVCKKAFKPGARIYGITKRNNNADGLCVWYDK